MKNPARAYKLLRELPATLRAMAEDIKAVKVAHDKLQNQHAKDMVRLSGHLDLLDQRQADTVHQLSALKKPKAGNVQQAVNSTLQADDHSLDAYYLAFEDKFRGTAEEIYSRLDSSYGKLLKSLPASVKKLSAIDIGCGRGEMLQLFAKNGFKKPLGIDLNEAMVENCKKRGYDAIQANALEYLAKQPAQSVGIISGIHIVEHLPFRDLLELANECYRVLAPGGAVIFETPNPESLTVGAFTFWHDSSHLKPIPPVVLEFIMQYPGFQKTEILRMRPEEGFDASYTNKHVKNMAQRVFGPSDYAVVAYRATSTN